MLRERLMPMRMTVVVDTTESFRGQRWRCRGEARIDEFGEQFAQFDGIAGPALHGLPIGGGDGRLIIRQPDDRGEPTIA